VSLCVKIFLPSPVPAYPACKQIHKELRDDTEKPREIKKLRGPLCILCVPLCKNLSAFTRSGVPGLQTLHKDLKEDTENLREIKKTPWHSVHALCPLCKNLSAFARSGVPGLQTNTQRAQRRHRETQRDKKNSVALCACSVSSV